MSLKQIFRIILLGILIFVLSGCEEKRPIYSSGTSMEEFGKEFGSWFGDKLSTANEAQQEEYENATSQIVKKYIKEVKNKTSETEILAITDTMIEKITDLSKKTYGFTIEDWSYISNPTVDASASKRSQRQVKLGIAQIIMFLPNYFPVQLDEPIGNALKNINSGKIYYHILKNSKFKQVIDDNEWVEKYEMKKKVLDVAINIAKSEKLYFDINSYKKIEKYQKDINKLKEKHDFKLIDNQNIIGNNTWAQYSPNHMDIYKLKKIVEIKDKSIYKKIAIKEDNHIEQINYYLKFAESGLINAKKSNHARNIIKYQNKIKTLIPKLKEATISFEKEFNKTYNNDIKVLNSQIDKIKELKKNKINHEKMYYHNVKVLIKTYQKLLDMEIEEFKISKYLLNSNRTFARISLKKHDNSKNTILESTDNYIFESYIEKMKNLKKGL